MSVLLTNRDDVIANSFSIITAYGAVVDILDTVQGSVIGLPPASLNIIGNLSAAIQMARTISKQSNQLLTRKPPRLHSILRLLLMLLLLRSLM